MAACAQWSKERGTAWWASFLTSLGRYVAAAIKRPAGPVG